MELAIKLNVLLTVVPAVISAIPPATVPSSYATIVLKKTHMIVTDVAKRDARTVFLNVLVCKLAVCLCVKTAQKSCRGK